jgi:hypothetical protein
MGRLSGYDAAVLGWVPDAEETADVVVVNESAAANTTSRDTKRKAEELLDGGRDGKSNGAGG